MNEEQRPVEKLGCLDYFCIVLMMLAVIVIVTIGVIWPDMDCRLAAASPDVSPAVNQGCRDLYGGWRKRFIAGPSRPVPERWRSP